MATIAGPTVGGAFVTWGNWRWVFFINIPIGVVGLIGALTLVPDLRLGRRHRLDLVGVALATGGLFAIVFGLIEGQRYDWGSIGGSLFTIPELIIAGAVLLALFLFWQRMSSEPLLPLTLFSRRNYSIATLLAGLSFFATFSYAVAFTVMMQSVLGLTPIQAGLAFLPMSLVMALTAPQAGRLTDRLGGRTLLVAGALLMALALLGIALLASPSATWATFAIPLACYGLGMGLLTAPSLALAMNAVSPTLAGAASGFYNTSRQVGGVIGVAVVGAVLQNQLVANLKAGASAVALQLPSSVRERFIAGFANGDRNGLEVGRGQTGSALPSDVPASVAQQIQQLAHDVFVNAFVQSIRPALVIPTALMVVGALCATLLERRATPLTGSAAPLANAEPGKSV